jgi:pilus assembly protein CpaB
MRAMFGLVLVAGVGLAGAAVYMAKGYISKTETALQRELAIKAQTGGLVEVYVVKKAVNYGEPLTKDDVLKSYLPKNTLPENTFGDIAILFPEDTTEPRYVLRQMEKFEPILAVKVTEPGEQAGLTGELEKGMRAFAIKVEAADFLQPGDPPDRRFDEDHRRGPQRQIAKRGRGDPEPHHDRRRHPRRGGTARTGAGHGPACDVACGRGR